MIQLTRLNGKIFNLNLDLIEIVEEVPDTVVTTTTGTKYIVRESSEEIREQVIKHKQEVLVVLKG